MGFQGRVGIALEEEFVLLDVVGLGESLIDIAELERRLPVHVGAKPVSFTIPVDQWL